MRIKRRRSAWLSLLALPVAPGAAVEVEPWALSILRLTDVAQSPVNPGNALGQPRLAGELALGAGAELAGITLRGRLATHAQQVNGRRIESADFTLQELARTFALSERLSLVVGKRMLSWDVALSSTPLGFFQKTPDFTDVTDRFERAEGLPLLALAYVADAFDLTLVYSDDSRHRPDGFNRGLRQLAANLTWSPPRASYSLVAQKPRGQPLGLGFAAVLTVTDSLTVHASGFSRRGTSRPISRRVVERSFGFDLADPNGPWRMGSGERFSRWVVGASWAGRSGASAIVEWSHDDAGLGRGDWQHWRELVEHHTTGDLAGVAAGTPADGAREADVRALNLAFDAAALRPGGARRDYAFLRIARPFGGTSLALLARAGVPDGDAFVNVSFERALGSRAACGIALAFHFGAAGTEMRHLPVRSSAQAWLKYAF